MIIRDLEEKDISNGYFELLYQLSNFKIQGDKDTLFQKYLGNKNYIIRVAEENGEIVGAGSLIILDKLHCNPMGQIEDVVVKDGCRSKGLGRVIISDLVTLGKKHGCYKIVLNSLDYNIGFYKKCGFTTSGVQMKII